MPIPPLDGSKILFYFFPSSKLEMFLSQYGLIVFFLDVYKRQALRCGDDTAERLGRLSLNPLRHLDPIGSVALPLLLILMKSGFVFGWAKPVPYNPLKLKNPRRDTALLAFAGPLANFSVALIFGLIIRAIMITSSFVSLLPFLVIIVQDVYKRQIYRSNRRRGIYYNRNTHYKSSRPN